jgi:hypothetical protein
MLASSKAALDLIKVRVFLGFLCVSAVNNQATNTLA